jgi:hypothetical protein
MASGGETPEPRDAPHQTPLDPERILRQLNRAGVDYVLIGGFAVVIHGYERLTGDLDICYARTRENVTRLVDVLRSLRAWPREWPQGVPFILDAQTILNGDSFTFNTEAGDLDLVVHRTVRTAMPICCQEAKHTIWRTRLRCTS